MVVSRHRPAELALCLGALTLQGHPRMEVVLVADPASVGTRPDLPLKRVTCDAVNIGLARNLGVAAAAGEVVAFIDDDAVAEPGWAAHLAVALADASVVAAGGYTRGPHGRSWQARAEAITPDGPVPLPLPAGPAPVPYTPRDGVVLGLLGTNCAVRRDALVAVGGFDPAFAYHLDESDLALRLAARFPDRPSVLVPRAEVTHGTAPSERRGRARVPRDLTRIGRSEAIFAARHGGDPAQIEPRHRRRLLAHMLAGRLEPASLRALMTTLRAGIASLSRPDPAEDPSGPPLSAPTDAFLPLPTRPRAPLVIAGSWRRRRALRCQAAEAVSQGRLVTLLLLVPGILPHRTRFTPGGWWEQTGGTWGPSDPGDPALMPMGRAKRLQLEETRLLLGRNQAGS